jgi:uncharacterized protein YlxW (UPF0749 family)
MKEDKNKLAGEIKDLEEKLAERTAAEAKDKNNEISEILYSGQSTSGAWPIFGLVPG